MYKGYNAKPYPANAAALINAYIKAGGTITKVKRGKRALPYFYAA